MRGDVDAPVNVTSTEVDNLCGQGVNFRFQRAKLDAELGIGTMKEQGIKVDCKLENFIPDLHADKFGTVINHFDKLQAFYDAVSDAGLSVPADSEKSAAEKILYNYLYGSPSKRCSEHMEPAYRHLDTGAGM